MTRSAEFRRLLAQIPGREEHGLIFTTANGRPLVSTYVLLLFLRAWSAPARPAFNLAERVGFEPTIGLPL
jgi:hypothetical protein